MTANQKFAVTIVSIVVVVFCLLCTGLYLVNKVISNAPSQPEIIGYCEVPNCTPTEEVTPTPVVGWIGDDFGPEHTLPDTIVGPAIAELKSYLGSVCAVVKVNKGETLVWPGGGAYWEAGSQLALEARWPHHVDEYLANYAECKVYVTVVSVPNPTK